MDEDRLPPNPPRTPPSEPTPLDSRLLFGPWKAVQIAHSGQTYTLRITRENKLILTK